MFTRGDFIVPRTECKVDDKNIYNTYIIIFCFCFIILLFPVLYCCLDDEIKMCVWEAHYKCSLIVCLIVLFD